MDTKRYKVLVEVELPERPEVLKVGSEVSLTQEEADLLGANVELTDGEAMALGRGGVLTDAEALAAGRVEEDK